MGYAPLAEVVMDARTKSGHDREVRFERFSFRTVAAGSGNRDTSTPIHGVIAGLVPAIHEHLDRSGASVQKVQQASLLACEAAGEEAADHLGGVVDHRDDARIVEPRRADDADHADDLLLVVAIGRNDEGRAGE
jgi:hypothetical protein